MGLNPFKWLFGLRAGKLRVGRSLEGTFGWRMLDPVKTRVWEFELHPSLFEDIELIFYADINRVVDDEVPVHIALQVRHGD